MKLFMKEIQSYASAFVELFFRAYAKRVAIRCTKAKKLFVRRVFENYPAQALKVIPLIIC